MSTRKELIEKLTKSKDSTYDILKQEGGLPFHDREVEELVFNRLVKEAEVSTPPFFTMAENPNAVDSYSAKQSALIQEEAKQPGAVVHKLLSTYFKKKITKDTDFFQKFDSFRRYEKEINHLLEQGYDFRSSAEKKSFVITDNKEDVIDVQLMHTKDILVKQVGLPADHPYFWLFVSFALEPKFKKQLAMIYCFNELIKLYYSK